MIRRLIVSALAFVAVVGAALADCPRCHGSGRVLAVPETASYGVSNKKVTCPYCGLKVLPGHRCECPVCHGTGNAPGRSRSSSGSGDDVDIERSGLSSSEYLEVQELTRMLMQQTVYYEACGPCGGTGVCPTCRNGVNPVCPCQGTLICMACNGTKQDRTPHYRGVDADTKAKLEARIRAIYERAAKRNQAEGEGRYGDDDEQSSSDGAYGPWGEGNDASEADDSYSSNREAGGKSFEMVRTPSSKSSKWRHFRVVAFGLLFYGVVIALLVKLVKWLLRRRRAKRDGK